MQPNRRSNAFAAASNAATTRRQQAQAARGENQPVSLYSYRTPVGVVTLAASDRGLTHAAFGGNIASVSPAIPRKASALTNQAANELLEYLAGKRQTFDVPLDPFGSDFQKRVWEEVALIPYGETRTSAQVAQNMRAAGSHRSVGIAIKKNPLAVFIPDHRIADAQGKTTGAGKPARQRAMLLAFEQIQHAK